MAEENIQDQGNNDGQPGARMAVVFGVLFELVLMWIQWVMFMIESIYLLFVPREEKSVNGEIVLITGTGHGIGKQLALQYAKLGAIVVCWDINETGNLETVDEIKRTGGVAHAYVCDVSKRDQIFTVAERVKNEVGNITIIVNNAGIMPTHPLLQHTENEIKKIFDINVLAHFWIIQCFLPAMISKNRGHIVALSSMAGVVGLSNLVPYCGSKFAVRGIMEALYEELRSQGITNIKFTSIYPYMVDTGLCKKPKMRFENAMKLVTPEQAATAIISAQRQEIPETSIPKYLLYLNTYTRLFPLKCGLLLRDFFDSGVESDLPATK